jgi:hypothetical protein
MYLIGIYLIGVHFMGMCLTGTSRRRPIGRFWIGLSLSLPRFRRHILLLLFGMLANQVPYKSVSFLEGFEFCTSRDIVFTGLDRDLGGLGTQLLFVSSDGAFLLLFLL